MTDVMSGEPPRRRDLIELCAATNPGYPLFPQTLLADFSTKPRPTFAKAIGRALVRLGLFLQGGEGAHAYIRPR